MRMSKRKAAREPSAPSVAIFLRLRLRFSVSGGKSQRFFGFQKCPPPPQESHAIFLATENRKRLRFFARPPRGFLGDGCHTEVNCSNFLRLRFLVLFWSVHEPSSELLPGPEVRALGLLWSRGDGLVGVVWCFSLDLFLISIRAFSVAGLTINSDQ